MLQKLLEEAKQSNTVSVDFDLTDELPKRDYYNETSKQVDEQINQLEGVLIFSDKYHQIGKYVDGELLIMEVNLYTTGRVDGCDTEHFKELVKDWR